MFGSERHRRHPRALHEATWQGRLDGDRRGCCRRHRGRDSGGERRLPPVLTDDTRQDDRILRPRASGREPHTPATSARDRARSRPCVGSRDPAGGRSYSGGEECASGPVGRLDGRDEQGASFDRISSDAGVSPTAPSPRDQGSGPCPLEREERHTPRLVRTKELPEVERERYRSRQPVLSRLWQRAQPGASKP